MIFSLRWVKQHWYRNFKPITAKHGYFIRGKFDHWRNIPYSAIVDALQNWCSNYWENPMNRWKYMIVSTHRFKATDKS